MTKLLAVSAPCYVLQSFVYFYRVILCVRPSFLQYLGHNRFKMNAQSLELEKIRCVFLVKV